MKKIILIHGLFMNSLCFYFMQKELKKYKNFDIETFEYHSLLYDEKILDKLNSKIEGIKDNTEIVIVAHSLGGLITRLYLDKFKPQKNIRIITLGTPHNQSLVAQKIKSVPFIRPILGFSTNAGLTKEIPKWTGQYPLISVAGTQGFGVANILLPGIHDLSDGTVFLDETKLDKAKHVIIENCNHLDLLTSKASISKVIELIG